MFITEATFGLPVFRHGDPDGEIGKLLHSVAVFPERAHLVGAYSLGKAQRVIALIRKAGYDKPIYLHGAMETITRYYESRGIALGDLRAVRDAKKAELAGAIAICPPSALQEVWSRRFPDPVSSFASGWMRVRARARQRGVELPLVISDHSDWDGLTATIAATGAPEIWVTHGQEDALVHWCTERGLKARPLAIVGYGDEDESDGVTDGKNRRDAMKRFAELLDRLSYEPGRNNKLRLMTDYFRHTPDPDRGYALAALTGSLSFQYAKPNVLRTLITERVDPVLFGLSRDYVGDTSETIALMWPAPAASLPKACRTLRCNWSAPLPPRSGGEGSGVGGEAAHEEAPPTPNPSPPHASHVGGGERTEHAASAELIQPAHSATLASCRSPTSSPPSPRWANPNSRRSSRAGSTRSTRPAAGRCSSSSPARCGSAFRRGSPRPRRPRSATRTCRRSS